MTPVLVGETVSPRFAVALREIGRVGAERGKAKKRRPRAAFAAAVVGQEPATVSPDYCLCQFMGHIF